MKVQNISRRRIIWNRIRGVKAVTASVIATALGVGFSPIAPGTMGTLIALPLAYCTQDWPWPARVALWVSLTAIGTWAAKTFDQLMETADNQSIVIDEVVGLGITSWTCGPELTSWLAAFIAFRVFDILKPPPIRDVDRWSKKQASPWWSGFGVIADDILAGLEALVVILLLQWWDILP